MADATIANLTDGATAVATDRIPVERSPFGAGTNRYISPLYLATYLGFSGGDLAFSALAQGSALSILGVTGNAIADYASIAAASDHQVLRRSGTALTFGAVNLAQSAAVTGILPTANGGTGIAYFTVAGPTVARVYTFPDAAATMLYAGGDLGTPSAGVGTNITGVNAATLGGATFAAPGTIGGGTPGAATFTTVGATTFTGALTGTASGNLVSGGALGTPSSATLTNATGLPEGGLSLTDITTANASATAHGFVPKWPNNTTTFFRGDGTYAAPAGGASTLDGITAATADQAGIANADWNVRWNWAKVTNSEVAFELGESAAATGGTSTSGVPNQVLAKFSTLAASTMSPLSVYSRAAHVFSVSPTTAQILATDGTNVAPAYSFASALGTGFSNPSGQLSANVTGTRIMRWSSTQTLFLNDGTAAAPAIQSSNWSGSGLWVEGAAGHFGIASNAGGEQIRFGGGIAQASKGSADAVGYLFNARKSRGTAASPTVITTGDDLLTISGYGYLGATNTYELAAQIKYDSIGTIADTTSGIGGVIRFLTANQGTVGVVEKMTIWNDGDVTIGVATPATTATIGFPQAPTMSGTPTGVPTVKTGFNPMVYDTTGRKLWIYDYGGTPAWVGVVLA